MNNNGARCELEVVGAVDDVLGRFAIRFKERCLFRCDLVICFRLSRDRKLVDCFLIFFPISLCKFFYLVRKQIYFFINK